MASAMASLITGATTSIGVRTQSVASRGAISRLQPLPQSVFAIRRAPGVVQHASSLSSSQFKGRSRKSGCSSVVCAAASEDSSSSASGSNGAVIGSAAVSRAILVVAVVAQAVARAAKALGDTLTATPLPDGSTNAEKELVTALKGRLVLAAGPLFFAAITQTPGSVSTPLTVVASGMAKWLELYSGVLMVRVLLSWFPNIPWERQPLQAVRDMCDPYLNLFRNIIPPLFNALDLSPMLAFMVLGVLTSILNTTAR
ncbi:hypothetical protein KC19_2G270000 [Ceratodon purpureus]|uniref:Uncharacterized protein n=1 Tax=Ceratodon purpureus TaxID=3225 RepID=A0A8T0IYK0_CERPU|nr:hypothetical protein KC19_2G270000 [Ceratodon purpureus]